MNLGPERFRALGLLNSPAISTGVKQSLLGGGLLRSAFVRGAILTGEAAAGTVFAVVIERDARWHSDLMSAIEELIGQH